MCLAGGGWSIQTITITISFIKMVYKYLIFSLFFILSLFFFHSLPLSLFSFLSLTLSTPLSLTHTISFEAREKNEGNHLNGKNVQQTKINASKLRCTYSFFGSLAIYRLPCCSLHLSSSSSNGSLCVSMCVNLSKKKNLKNWRRFVFVCFRKVLMHTTDTHHDYHQLCLGKYLHIECMVMFRELLVLFLCAFTLCVSDRQLRWFVFYSQRCFLDAIYLFHSNRCSLLNQPEQFVLFFLPNSVVYKPVSTDYYDVMLVYTYIYLWCKSCAVDVCAFF